MLLCSKGMNTFVIASHAWEQVNVELDYITDEFYSNTLSNMEKVLYGPRWLESWGRDYHETRGERPANFYVALVKRDVFPPPQESAAGYGGHLCFDHTCLESQAALVLYNTTSNVMAHEISRLFRATIEGETHVLCEEYLAEDCPDRIDLGYHCHNPSPRSGTSCSVAKGQVADAGYPEGDKCNFCIMSYLEPDCTRFVFCP